MLLAQVDEIHAIVALLAEGVDRNSKTDRGRYQKTGSPSSRRAWIEMPRRAVTGLGWAGRPPRGGRG